MGKVQQIPCYVLVSAIDSDPNKLRSYLPVSDILLISQPLNSH